MSQLVEVFFTIFNGADSFENHAQELEPLKIEPAPPALFQVCQSLYQNISAQT